MGKKSKIRAQVHARAKVIEAQAQDHARQQDQVREAAANIWDHPVDLLSLVDVPPPPIPWFCVDRLPSGRGCLLTGIGGSSKTRTIYHLGTGSIIGRLTWDWDVAAQGRAVLILTEDTEADVHRTLDAMCRSMGLSAVERREVFENMITYPLAGKDMKLLVRTPGGLVKSAHFMALEKKILSIQDVVFIGIDPALSVSDGDEMSQSDQRALGKMADDLAVRTGATCMLVAHATKGSLQKIELESHNSRGGGAITDAVRAEYSMRTMTADEAIRAGISDMEERLRHVQLCATKFNMLPPSARVPVWLRRDNTGTLHQVDVSMDGTGPRHDETRALEILADMAATSTPSLADWRDACIAERVIPGKTEDARRKKMQRIVTRLRDAGMIVPGIGKGIWLPAGGTETPQNLRDRTGHL